MKLKLSLLLAWMIVSPITYSAGYTETRYPIVLAHGLLGFDNIAGINYWHGIPYALRSGGAEVFVTQVSAVNSSEARGEQLLAQVEEILAITGADKVNLIGHSHGGQSVRYVAAVIPDMVASVTTVGSPVKGSPVADLIQDFTDIPLLGTGVSPILSSVVEGLGLVIGLAAGESLPQDAIMSMKSLSTVGATEFNYRFPSGVPDTECGEGAYQDLGIQYYSWSGTYSGITNYLDTSSYGLLLTKLAFDEANDGLVGRCSSHFGRVIRDNYDMDHLDEIDQLFGLVHIFSTNPKSIYRQHANRLRNSGL